MTAFQRLTAPDMPWLPHEDPLSHRGTQVTWAAAALLGLHAMLAWLIRTPGYTTINDHSTYVFLARSLLEGGYHEIWRVDAPWHTQYPPIFPAFIALIIATVGEHVDVFHATVIAWSVGGLAVMFAAVKRLWGPSVALGTLAAAAVNPALVERAGAIMAEPMFIAFIALSLGSLVAAAPTPRRLVLAGTFAIAAALTRTAGLPLVVAVGLYMLSRREWKTAAWYSLAVTATVGAWMLFTVLAPEKVVGRSYIADATYPGYGAPPAPSMLPVIAERVIKNVPGYFVSGLPWQLGFPNIAGTPLDNGIAVVLIGLGLLMGMWSTWRRWRPALLTIVLYAAMLAVWPWREGRFLEPLLPLLFTLVLVGLTSLGVAIAGRRGGAVAFAAVLLLVLGGAGVRTGRAVARFASCDRAAPGQSPGCFNVDERNFFAAVDFVSRTTPPESVVLVAKDSPFAMLAQRKVSIAHDALQTDTANFFDHLQAHGVSRIVLTHISYIDDPLSSRLLDVCRRLVLETALPPLSSVYSWTPVSEAAPDDSGPACAELRRYRQVAPAIP